MNDIERALVQFENFKRHGYKSSYLPSTGSIEVAMEALEEIVSWADPQPLTLEQLRQMDGKPVKIYEDGEYQYGLVSLSGNWFTQEEVITLSNGNFYLFNELAGNAEIYNIAYDHEPKEI